MAVDTIWVDHDGDYYRPPKIQCGAFVSPAFKFGVWGREASLTVEWGEFEPDRDQITRLEELKWRPIYMDAYCVSDKLDEEGYIIGEEWTKVYSIPLAPLPLPGQLVEPRWY